ncbi:MAG: efflux RND transporter periplasmic adaptor subunit [Cyclobacteriaceae bacterium]|nr:efflux RND transporter periplasmic adaptor subunit [Cyclobacteriaceae bacterium]
MKKLLFIILFIVMAVALFFALRSNKNKLDMKQKISESQLEKIPVRIDTVKKRMMGENYDFAAMMNPEKELMVVSQTQGEVEQVNVKVGDHVNKGQILVRVDDDILQANLMVAEANFEKAKKDLERFENMIEENGITQDQLEKMSINLKNAEANYLTLVKRIDQTTLEAPFEGFINQLFTKEGAMLGPGTPVFEIVNIRKFKLSLNVSETEIITIREGMKAEIRPKAVDSVLLEGTVSSKAISSGMSQQYSVEVIAENTYPEFLKGGMLAQVRLIPETGEEILSVPLDIIRNDEGSTYVFRVSDHVAIKTWINTGRRSNNYIQVTDGLSENDLVVITGMDNLTDGQEVRIIQERSDRIR